MNGDDTVFSEILQKKKLPNGESYTKHLVEENPCWHILEPNPFIEPCAKILQWPVLLLQAEPSYWTLLLGLFSYAISLWTFMGMWGLSQMFSLSHLFMGKLFMFRFTSSIASSNEVEELLIYIETFMISYSLLAFWYSGMTDLLYSSGTPAKKVFLKL